MSGLKRAENPFYFATRLTLRELTGKKARNIKELLRLIKSLPGSVIYNHTHQFLQQHIYLSPEPPNDFAYWVREFLKEDVLAEKLTSIDTCAFNTIRGLRNEIVKTIKDHLAKEKGPCQNVRPGSEFHFIKAYSFVVPTPYIANNLEEFLDCVKKISVHSLYFHMFESRLRLERPTNDFSFWLGTSLYEIELAEEISRLDPYTYTLEDLRSELVKKTEKYLRWKREE
jgi:hypothetical protein